MGKIYALKDSLDKDPRVLLLLEKEKAMEEDEEVMVLSYRFSRAQDDYNDALRHYASDSEEVKSMQKNLYIAKKNLDMHPKVEAYLQAYKVVRELYAQMQEALFAPFQNEWICQEKK